MHTSAEALTHLQNAVAATRAASEVIDNLIIEHDYQDVAALVSRAAEALLESTALLMESKDEAALDALERADDLLDAVYDIIDSEIDEE